MSHACKSLLLRCIDFRLGKAINDYLEKEGLLNGCDIVSVAGAAKNIASPQSENDREFVLRQIETSKKLHGISEVILMNHTDCGAYGGKAAFTSEEAERTKHAEDMKRAAEVISERLPDVQIKLVLASMESGSVLIGNIDDDVRTQ